MTNPNDPIEVLLAEHVVILRQADELEQAMARLEEAGPDGLEAEWSTLQSFAGLLAGTLALHARKEDDALFPAVEDRIGSGAGPTSVMRQEHQEIHQKGVEFRAVLKELHEVEHPQVEEKSEAYQEMVDAIGSGAKPDLEAMQSGVRDLLALMRLHFRKEEEILFPMTYNLLDKDTLAEVARQMLALETGGAG